MWFHHYAGIHRYRYPYTGARKLCAQPKFIALSIALGIAPSIK